MQNQPEVYTNKLHIPDSNHPNTFFLVQYIPFTNKLIHESNKEQPSTR